MMNKNLHQAAQERKEAESSFFKDDINVMADVKELKKLFLKELIIVWHHSQANSENFKDCADKLQNITTLKTFNDWNNALNFIEEIDCPCIIITSENLTTENLIKTVCEKDHVFSVNILANEWTLKHKKILSVESNFQIIIDKVGEQVSKWQKKESSLRFDLPLFSPIFNDYDKSENNYLNVHLSEIKKFGKRSQMKADFLALAREVYSEEKNIEEFESKYNDYDMKSVFDWYTRDSFFYKLINKSLRLAKPDTIYYCRLVLKDLETAIKECYQKKSKNFNGLLYRGAIISDDDWKRLEQNEGKEIEMHGFMSTSINPDTAEGFAAMGPQDKQTLITIIVPDIPSEGGQGFAEIDEFSCYKGEGEVLFNIRSRFTVLEVGFKEVGHIKFRHVALLYGARDLRGYMRHKNPVIQIDLKDKKSSQCGSCHVNIEFSKSNLFVNLEDTAEFFCYNCIQSAQDLNIGALACLKATSTLDLKVEGQIIKKNKKLEIPFYGYKCRSCDNTDIKRFMKCQDCKEEKKHWCNNCFSEENSCLHTNHVIIIEIQPYAFWSEKMTLLEALTMITNRQFEDQGKVLQSTHNYDKAKEYYEKRLAVSKSKIDADTAIVYMSLGLIHIDLRELEKALYCVSNALKIFETTCKTEVLAMSVCHSNLAVIYMEQGKLGQAEISFLKVLEIFEKNCKDKHPYIAGSYNNLGMIYERQGNFKKALEYQLKALDKYKELSRGVTIEMAGCSNNIGSIYGRLGDATKAIDYHSTALKIRKAIYGDKHPETAYSYSNVGALYGMLGQIENGIECMKSGLRVSNTIYGEKHPITAACYNNLGFIYHEIRKWKEAEVYYLKALEIRRKISKNQNADIAALHHNLGEVYKGLGQLEKSEKSFLEAIQIKEEVLQKDHPDTATSYNSVGVVYMELGQLGKAAYFIFIALCIRHKSFGKTHPLVAKSSHNLALCFRLTKNLEA